METGSIDKSRAMAEAGLRTTNMPSLDQALAASGARDKSDSAALNQWQHVNPAPNSEARRGYTAGTNLWLPRI
jgi:hypothetical protein